MSKLEQAARQALEALERAPKKSIMQRKAITAMREALDHYGEANEMVQEPDYKALWEQMCKRCDALDSELAKYTEQEPKFWTYMVNGAWRNIDSEEPPDDAYDEGTLEPLYAAPVRTKDLTDEEIANAVGEFLDTMYSEHLQAYREVIAADREKNK